MIPPRNTHSGEQDGPDDAIDVRAFMRSARLNRSAALDTILDAFSREPDRGFRAVDFTKEANVPAGSVYPILDKLVRCGAVEVQRAGEPRPASVKTYSLSDSGARFAMRYFAIRMGV